MNLAKMAMLVISETLEPAPRWTAQSFIEKFKQHNPGISPNLLGGWDEEGVKNMLRVDLNRQTATKSNKR